MLDKIQNEIKDLLITEIKPLNSGGQKQVYIIKIQDETCLLKVISLFPTSLNKNNYDEDIVIEIEELVEARLKRELKLMKLCSDRFPKILYIEDYKKFEDNNNNYAFYLEEYINGEDLYCIMKTKSKFEIVEIIHFLKSMIKTLICMEKNDIVHRDIKPKNIIVADNDYFLIDLGLCRQTYEDETLTISFQTLGTEAYKSPEQRRGVRTDYKWDFRNDLYAIGLIIMEMFLPETRTIRYENVDLRALKQLWYANSTNEVDKTLFDSIVVRLLAIERFARFKTITEMNDAVVSIEKVVNK